ncbi:HNH endonuclease [Streptomyces pseudogriseolus]|uniref:HNH endonuclease n=1 Tax=Streptomyces pseudogriseolus TaxID=36817 RepID=UPI003FA2BA58
MYCDDSLGTDIDHFQPIALAPLRAFVWANHLLACSHCNSNEKREQYPLAADGTCLLIDPTAEDPADHLVLLLSSGVYDHRTDKGEATIEVFGLNRPDLIAGRKDAFFTARAIFRDWYDLHKDGHPDADTTAQALLNSPFVDVVYAMTRLKPHLAETVVGPRTVPALQHWRSVHGGIPGTRN